MTAGTRPKPRILHLAFEDHLRPGSGGGGVRTREINRRLAGKYDITVVTSRYPGAEPRIEDGVHYRPVGLDVGHLGSMATYHLALPLLLLTERPDLVVEDFAAPMSSVLVPLWTRRPTLAVVQWLAARETSRRYHLPFFVFEELGMRLHRRFIAVSGAIADRLRAANPRADIRVVYAGIDLPAGFDGVAARRQPAHIVYLGRIEFQPKGLDLLVEAVSRLADVPGLCVTIAGDGPHRSRLVELLERRGLSERFRLVGRVEGRAKWELLSEASVVAIPSRYESFGLVAAEALSVGTPVVAWSLPSLLEILGSGGGWLVEPFDVGAFAAALRAALAENPDRRSTGPGEGAARFDWDTAAEAHDRAYAAALSSEPGGRRRLRGRRPKAAAAR